MPNQLAVHIGETSDHAPACKIQMIEDWLQWEDVACIAAELLTITNVLARRDGTPHATVQAFFADAITRARQQLAEQVPA